jgi:ABC-type sugar transport system substrate-binding protein
VDAGVAAGVEAIVLWIVDPAVPAAAAGRARAAGIPVVTLERPHFPVDASVVYPNFNHGVYMSEYLATLLPPNARVAVVGGPDVVDDIELMLGLLHGLDTAGLTRVNDPEDPRYKNTTDVASGGKEKTANILADFDHLDGLIPFNDETLLGAVEALRDAGRLGEVKMVSRNGTPAAVELVRAGIHHGTWDIDGPGIGAAAAGLVLQALAGQRLDGFCVASPIGAMITAERAKTWVPWDQRVARRPPRVGLGPAAQAAP